ncbi:hypothetical protein MKX03_006843 [Papaver bracteatum]|nr:hypothetical protein MKX03_006843 [Papaver bracteatum]
MATPPSLDFWGVLSESRKIMKSHSRHFLALSVLFLLPISFSIVAFHTFQLTINRPEPKQPESLLRFTLNRHEDKLPNPKFLVCSLIYGFIVLVLSLCATGTITYSVYHGFFGRPVKLMSAIKSLLNSLLRLFTTVVSSLIVVVSISVFVTLVLFVIILVIEQLGFEISHYTENFSVFCVIGTVVLGLVVLYLFVNWSLAFVIVTIESSWGFDPLMRSKSLLKGMRGVSLSLLLFYGSILSLIVWLVWKFELGDGVVDGAIFVCLTVLASACLMAMMLNCIASYAVLYMYCKALHGELALEIAEEFSGDYVSLPFDEEKVPYVVTVVQQP